MIKNCGIITACIGIIIDAMYSPDEIPFQWSFVNHAPHVAVNSCTITMTNVSLTEFQI